MYIQKCQPNNVVYTKKWIKFLEDMVNQRDKDLNCDERDLLSIAYNNSI